MELAIELAAIIDLPRQSRDVVILTSTLDFSMVIARVSFLVCLLLLRSFMALYSKDHTSLEVDIDFSVFGFLRLFLVIGDGT